MNHKNEIYETDRKSTYVSKTFHEIERFNCNFNDHIVAFGYCFDHTVFELCPFWVALFKKEHANCKRLSFNVCGFIAKYLKLEVCFLFRSTFLSSVALKKL